MNNRKLYDFEGFRVDTEQKCLWRGDELVSITPKAFETLLVLVKNKGNLVTKNSLLDEVWKDTFVEESTLAQNISTLRKALAKYDKDKEFIVTIPRRGYRFVADVTESLSEDEVLVLEKHSVTHIIAEQEDLNASDEVSVAPKRKSDGLNNSLLFALPAALALLLIGGFVSVYFLSSSKNYFNSRFNKFKTNTLFSSGSLLGVVASPDGKYIGIVERNSDGDSISLKQTGSENTIKVLPKSNLTIAGISFSPESENIFYTAYPKDGSSPRVAGLYKIPILGGAPQEILKDIDSPVAVSNDGKRLAFTRNKLDVKKSVLVISEADGSNEKELKERDLRDGFSNFGVSWSPNGNLISAVIRDTADEKLPTKLVVIDAETSEQKVLSEENWLWIGRTRWLKDGSGIALVAYGSQSPNITDEIWFVSYPDGNAKRISNGIKGIIGFSLTDDLNSIFATRMTRITSSYVAPIGDLENVTEISKTADEASLFSLGTDWTTDGKLIYSRTLNGNADIWTMDSDGSNQKQLTSDKSADFAPRVSSGGTKIFFLSNRDGSIGIWRIDSNGENPTKIIEEKGIGSLSVSRTDDKIYFSAKSPVEPFNVLWKADSSGENITPLTKTRTYGGKVSPDGKSIFAFFPDANEDANDVTKPLKLTVLSAETGEIVKQFASLKSRTLPMIEWMSDSKSFLILEKGNGKSSLSKQDLDTEEPKRLKEWKEDSVYQIAVSKEGEKVFFDKGKEVNGVIQLENIAE